MPTSKTSSGSRRPLTEPSSPVSPRTDRISIRISDEERVALERNLGRSGTDLELGAWIRQVALNASDADSFERTGARTEPGTVDLLATLRAELSAEVGRAAAEIRQVHAEVALLLIGINGHGRALARILKLLGAA